MVVKKEAALVVPTVAAYTAGLIDGEGSISLIINRTILTRTADGRPRSAVSPMLVVQVANTCRDVLTWLQESWGVGTVVQVYRPKRPHHKPCYGYRVRGQAAAEMLRQVRPYMKIKQVQADLGMQAQALVRPSVKLGDAEMEHRMTLREEMMRLNGTTSRPRRHADIGILARNPIEPE